MKNLISFIAILIFNFQIGFSQDSCDNPQGEVSGPLTSQYSFANWASVCAPVGEGNKIVDFEIIQDSGSLSTYALTNLWFFWSTDCETGPFNWNEGPVNISEQNIELEEGECIYYQLYDYYGYASSASYSMIANLFDADDAGCTDPTAFNYNGEALFDDGSCVYGGTFACNGVPGVITYNYGDNEDQTFAYNTDNGLPLQIVFSGAIENSYDDIYVSNSAGTLIAALTGTLNQSFIFEDGIVNVQLTSDGSVNSSTNSSYIPSWTLSCISDDDVIGCTDPEALNYNVDATIDDGLCSFPLAIEIDLPYETTSTNCGSGDDFNSSTVSNISSSSYYLGGEDIAYSFIGDGSMIDINLTTAANYTGLWLFEGNPNENGVEVASSLSYNGNEFISYQTIDGNTYFVVLDSWPSPNCYSFDLSIIPLTGIGGCTDSNADNYDETVDYNNGSCEYSCPFVDGVDITTVTYNCYDYIVNLGYTLDQMIDYGYDCTCVEESLGDIVFGCTDENASNYNPDATNNDGSCVFPIGIEINLPFETTSTNCGSGDNINSSTVNNISSPSYYLGGEDISYSFTGDGSMIDINLTTTTTYTGLWLFEGNPNENGVEVASSLSYNSNEFISYQTIEGNIYFVVLDSWPLPDCYSFDLSIIPLTGIGGCTDSNADNYDETVDYDNGSCEYSCPFVDGVDITTVTYNCYDYVVNLGYTLDQMINIYGFDCTCVEESLGDIVFGCTDENASNYNPEATNNDGSCVFSSTIDCNGEGVSQTYEYGDNENITFSYSNNDGQGLQIVFSGGTESCCDDINILNESGDLINSYAGVLDGESFITYDSSITIQFTSDGSVNSSTNSSYIPSWVVTCLPEDAVGGCTDSNADNYDETVDFDDNSCEYSCPFVDGVDITTVSYNCYDYILNYDYTLDQMISSGYDCSCVEESLVDIVFGCIDENASNYNPDATNDDGSCIFSSVIDCEGTPLTQTYEYGNNENINFSYSNDGDLGMQITFSGSVESGYDNIYIFNESGNQIGQITGDITNQLFATEESTITVQLTSDGSINSQNGYTPSWTVSCSNTEILSGCTESGAYNYDPNAQFDDGSCEYGGIIDCANGTTIGSYDYGNNENFEFTFTSSSGSDLELVLGGSAESCCDDINVFNGSGDLLGSYAGNINETIVSDDVIVIQIISDGSVAADYGYGITWSINCIGNDFGCTDEIACNFDPDASFDNGSCEFAEEGYDCNGNCLETFTIIVDCECEFLDPATYTVFTTEFDQSTCTTTEDCYCECINDSDGDGICDENEVTGCTDSSACNYDSFATDDDGSCEYSTSEICDGIDNDCDGIIDNNPILFGCEICINGNVINSDTDDDGICNEDEIGGCTDLNACNYDNNATDDDGSCEYIFNDCDICEGGQIINNDIDDDGICNSDEIPGCTDSTALNFNSTATDDDGSCIAIIVGCTDIVASNFNPSANIDNGTCYYGPWGDIGSTDCNMTVLIPGDAVITIEGQPISNGDWIGVFYTNEESGELICGGSALWTGETTSIAVWGSESELDNGFQFGEELIWGLFDNENELFISNAQVTYSFGENTYQCNALSGLESVDAVSTFVQAIPLNEGWGIWSTFIDPENTDMSSVFNEIVDDLVIAKDENGNVYWPMFGLNSIGSLTKGKGYQTKMYNDATLTLEGNLVPFDFDIDLESGWGIMGYLHPECFNTADMMAPIVSSIVIVKDENGNVYWPMFGLNSIGDLCPGRGYQIKTDEPIMFNYPENGGSSSRYGDVYVERPVHFDEPVNTGNNMIIGLPLNSWQTTPSNGDEIAAYGKDGTLIGSTTFQGDHIALTIWGDDLTTNKKEGISEGETISFKLWNSQTGFEQALEVRWSQGVGFYTTDGISVAGQIILGSELTAEKQLVKITDVLGREVNGDEKDVMLLYIYDDGSIERVYTKD